jgi:hypothetical protein
VIDKLEQGFKLPRSCLFPLNNAYVAYDDVATGMSLEKLFGCNLGATAQCLSGATSGGS